MFFAQNEKGVGRCWLVPHANEESSTQGWLRSDWAKGKPSLCPNHAIA